MPWGSPKVEYRAGDVVRATSGPVEWRDRDLTVNRVSHAQSGVKYLVCFTNDAGVIEERWVAPEELAPPGEE